jgi:hypothetical protein
VYIPDFLKEGKRVLREVLKTQGSEIAHSNPLETPGKYGHEILV